MASPERCRVKLRREPPPRLDTSNTTRGVSLGRSVTTLDRCSSPGRGGSLDVYEEESRRLEVVEEAERRSRLVERSDVLDEYIIRERDDVYGDDGTGILDTWTSATSRGIPGEHTPSLSLSAPACHWTLHASTGPLTLAEGCSCGRLPRNRLESGGVHETTTDCETRFLFLC